MAIKVCVGGSGGNFPVDPASSVSRYSAPLLSSLFDLVIQGDRWMTKRCHSYER